MDGFGRRTCRRRRMLEVEMLEDRLLLSSSLIAPVHPVTTPITSSAIHSSSVAANHPEVSYSGQSLLSATIRPTGQGSSIDKTLGSYFSNLGPRSEDFWVNGSNNLLPGISYYGPDHDDSDYAADKDGGTDLARANSHETAASSIQSLLSGHLEQIASSAGTTGGVSPASPANSLALGQSPSWSLALPGGTVQHVPPMLTSPAGPNMATTPLDQIGKTLLAQMNPADMPGAEQPQSSHDCQGLLRESFAEVVEALSADWGNLREEVGAFFTHLGQIGSGDTGWWNPGMVVPWLMVATAVALEVARRQGKRAPIGLPDEVFCRLTFFAEKEL